MSNPGQHASTGITFYGALFLVFLTLKLTGYIDWSWWWITAPLWGPWALVIGLVAIALPFVLRKKS